MYILVTGGAGFIGSHTVWLLRQQHTIIVLDRKKPAVVQEKVIYICGDCGDKILLEKIFSSYAIQAVIHCAASIEVGQSVKSPLSYYDNNLVKTLYLLEMMVKYHVLFFIFSSSAAVYGNPLQVPVSESCSLNPVNPYGKSKCMIESILYDYAHTYSLVFVSLRYFNVAGCQAEWELGELHEPETHLIPLLFRAFEENTPFTIFGNDYATADGTCIRDYIHVWDVAHAHKKALDYAQIYGSATFNVGGGKGYSVYEIVQMVEKVVEKNISLAITKRREGDPALLIADISKISRELSWFPEKDLEEIIHSTYSFRKNLKKRSFSSEQCPSPF